MYLSYQRVAKAQTSLGNPQSRQSFHCLHKHIMAVERGLHRKLTSSPIGKSQVAIGFLRNFGTDPPQEEIGLL